MTAERINESRTSWRGRAVEPLVREALARLLPDQGLPLARVIGGSWTRDNQVESDIVGAGREPVAKLLLFLGSIKWLNSPFDAHDLAALTHHRGRVTDEPLPLLAASRGGVSGHGLAAAYGPDELLAAWAPSR